MPEDKTMHIQVLWTELLQLNSMFSKGPEGVTDTVREEFKSRSREWVSKFISVYQTKNVTPYIHAMFNHVGEFMEMHGSILPFSQQGLEKLNDVMTKHYFRATSHQNEKALLQLIQKQNRIEHLKDMGAQPGRHHSVSCNNCSEIGHNMHFCVKPCKVCGHTPFRSHLVTSENGKNISLCMQEN